MYTISVTPNELVQRYEVVGVCESMRTLGLKGLNQKRRNWIVRIRKSEFGRDGEQVTCEDAV